jgi:hypothetical protein
MVNAWFTGETYRGSISLYQVLHVVTSTHPLVLVLLMPHKRLRLRAEDPGAQSQWLQALDKVGSRPVDHRR